MSPPPPLPQPQPRIHKTPPSSAEPRPSSSILLISPQNHILLLHRVKTSSSFASAHVFPGGNLSSAQDGPIPAPSSPERHVDSAVYRLGAIRECFEESGILLARRRRRGGNGNAEENGEGGMLEVEEEERERARHAVHRGELGFGEWVERMGGVVDVDALVPFTRWVTPVGVPRRFTTQMYVYFWPLASLPLELGGEVEGKDEARVVIPTPTSDGGVEHTAAVFQSCAAWLEQARRGEVMLFPPQFYLIWLLGKFLVGGSEGDVVELRAQRERAREFLRGGGANGVVWGEKVICPTAVGGIGGRAVLNLENPGPELKGSGRKGEGGQVVLVEFGKGGARDVEVMEAGEARRLLEEARGKL